MAEYHVGCGLKTIYEGTEENKIEEKGEYCPIMTGGGNQFVASCIKEDCAWWCDWGGSCAIPLLAGMFADSSVCNTLFPEVE